MKDNLGDRMKENYENRYRISLTRRTPVIVRIDGKAFHTFTKFFKRPFDTVITKTMIQTAKELCENIMGCQIAYSQSDEISLLLLDNKKLTSQAWFDNNLQKIVSVSASLATMAFNKHFKIYAEEASLADIEERNDIVHYNLYKRQFDNALFDARAFNIPEAEVCNYFIWRQQDATRNSIESVGHVYFTNKQLHGITCNEIQEKLFQEKNINWNDYPITCKRGFCIKKKYSENTEHGEWIIDEAIPIFTQNREYIEDLLIPLE